ncbi:hypothetical protein [Sneathiella aquimaris]|uniref:hypothetical protein n=1 Tax=Sneathiella aquimaris TaxID=2599305 RepID=UPI00146B116B|nr:hypothetical protein [Sneathiella aquimaris]
MLRPLVSVLNQAGYSYAVRFDMSRWAETRQQLDPDHQVVMPTFDPMQCDQSNSYWIEVTSAEREVVAVIAARRFDTPDFVEMMATGKVWADHPRHDRLTLALPKGFRMGGSILYRGGLCVKKSHRKEGLSWVLPRLVSLISIDQGIDFTVSHNLADLHGNGFTFRVYGHSHSALCFDGTEFFPPTNDRRKAYFVWTGLDDVIALARRDQEIIVNCGNENLSDLAVLAQRPSQMEVAPTVPRRALGG